MNALHRLDDRLMLAVNDFSRSTPWLHAPAMAFAKYGVVLFGLLLLAALVLARHRESRRLAGAGWAAAATLVAVAVNQPIGHAVGERRPYASHPGLLHLLPATGDFSFPSDHATMAGAAAVGVLLVSRRLGLLAVVLAVVMAFTRVYVGSHYPWDVAAGLALGALVTGLGWVVLRRPLTALTTWLRATPPLRPAFAVAPETGPGTA